MSRLTSLLGCAHLLASISLISCGGGPQPTKSVVDVGVDVDSASDEPPEQGSMDLTRLSYGLRGAEDSFRKCLMKSMDSRGVVTTQFSVKTDGTVASARVSDASISDKSVQQCLLDELSRRTFSEQQHATTNRFTFVFRLTDPLSDSERRKLLKKADRESGEELKIMPDSQGTIDLNHVAEIAQARYGLYAHCYRDSIRRRGESRGVVRFQLHIDARGRVQKIEDQGSVLPDPYAVDCMAEGFYLMEFDPPSGGSVKVRYSMELR